MTSALCLKCITQHPLLITEDNVRIVTEGKGVVDVIKALKAHKTHAELVEAACAALLSLSMEGEA